MIQTNSRYTRRKSVFIPFSRRGLFSYKSENPKLLAGRGRATIIAGTKTTERRSQRRDDERGSDATTAQSFHHLLPTTVTLIPSRWTGSKRISSLLSTPVNTDPRRSMPIHRLSFVPALYRNRLLSFSPLDSIRSTLVEKQYLEYLSFLLCFSLYIYIFM